MRDQLVQLRGHSFWDRFGDVPVLMDLGANVGRFTTDFLALHPSARVVLVEGDPYLTDILHERFARFGNVQLFRGLVGVESKACASFFLCKVPEGNSVFARFSDSWAPGESREISVETIALPALLKLSGQSFVDLLKVDIEGAEWDLLGALSEQQAACIGQISVEFHDFLAPELRPRTEACIAHLKKLGFAVLCRGTEHLRGSPYFDCLFYREE